MVWSDWWAFTYSMASHDRDDFGIYELADDSETTLYIGSGKVKTRLLEHLKKNECPLATRYRIDCCITEQEARAKEKHLLDAYKLVRNGRLPLYNRQLATYETVVADLSRGKEVKDIMSHEVAMVNPETSLVEAARIMGEKHIGSLIVTKYELPVGIVTERDLLSKVLALGKNLGKMRVEEAMSHPLATIEPTAKIKEAAKMMTQKKSRLVVFDCRKLIGIVTASDLTRCLPEAKETELKVDDFMTIPVETADEKTPAEIIAKIMGEKRIGSIVITRGGKPFGIFTERDLLTNFLAQGKPLSSEVGKEASIPLITAPSGTTVYQAAVAMATHHIRRLPIEKNSELAGIITARDLVEAYAK
jgi:CBS domain-containing protein